METNALTVDVEDWFQVQAFAGLVRVEDWDSYPSRVVANTDRLLELFGRVGVHGTFFTLGWVARRHPELVRRIVAGGHELASHGTLHQRVDTQTPAVFREDIRTSRLLLEDLGGVAVDGYRAPTFSINRRSAWAFAVLAEEGFRYSSSVYPVKHDLYGMPDAPRFPYRPDPNGVLELPMTATRIGQRNVPCAGGGYFRLLPYPVFRGLLRRFNRQEGKPGIFYTHPWEIDPDQPRMAGAEPLARFRHTVNLSRTFGRIERLLGDFAWDRMDRVYADVLAAPASWPALAA